MIGLAGAHRTGKTTVAKEFAEKTGMPYYTISASDVIASMGLTCDQIMDLDTRLNVQEALVMKCDEVFGDAVKNAPFIADRTPLDVAAYLLADAGQELSDPQIQKINKLVSDCFTITNGAFQAVMYVPMGIPYKWEPGKPLPNSAYQYHIGSIILGLLGDVKNQVPYWFYTKEAANVTQRIAILDHIWQETCQTLQDQVEAGTSH